MQKKIGSLLLCFIIYSILTAYYGTGLLAASARSLRGNPLAPVTIVEYADFQCPDCAQAKLIVDQALEKYDGQVNLELKHRPLHSHAFATPAARIFEALSMQNQGKAWQFYDAVMTEQSALKTNTAGLQYFIDKLNLTINEQTQLSADLANPAIDEKIIADIQEGNRLALHEVPSFFINNLPIKDYRSLNNFSQVIEPLLQKSLDNSQSDQSYYIKGLW